MGWGAWERNCRLGVDLTASGGGASRTVTATFYFDSTVRVTDTTNTLSWNGARSGSKTPGMSRDGAGVAQIHQISWTEDLVYGSGRSISLSSWMKLIEYVPDGRLDCWGSVDLPARPYELPNQPPSVSVTRVSDTQHNVSWTTNWTGEDGPRPWHIVDVERWDNVSNTWIRIANVAWDVTSFSDTSTQPDRVYRYRVRANNSAGSSAWTEGTPTDSFTTPAAHTNLLWKKDGADVVLEWTKTSTLAVQTEIQESTNGGSTWTTVATVPAGTSTWRHSSPSTLVTHRYQIRPVVGGRTGAWTVSTVVQLLTAPAAPSNLAPGSVTLDSIADPITATWQHNPLDGTAQAAYELRYRIGAAAWTTVTGTTASSRTFAAGTWPYGAAVEWQVRTKGQHVDWSPWSVPALFRTGAKPIATIQTPAAGVEVATPDMPISWTYFDAESTAQAGAEIELWDGLALVWSRSVSGVGATVQPPPVANGATLTVKVRVLDGSGLWSLWTTRTVVVDFVPPPTPAGSVTWDDTLGVAVITITNPPRDPGDDLVDAQYNQVWRSLDAGRTWVLVADLVLVDGTVTDRAALAFGTSWYRITAVSSTPTAADSAPIVLQADTCWLWLSGGPGLDVVARARAQASVATSTGRPKKLHRFVGDASPTEFAAPTARDSSWAISGKVAAHPADDARTAEWSSWAAWEAISMVPAPILFRDPLGRRAWVSISDVSVTHQPGESLATVSCTVTRVGGHD